MAMPDRKRGERLLQLAVVLLGLLSLRVELGRGEEALPAAGTELVAKHSDPRASRAKRRGSSDVLRG